MFNVDETIKWILKGAADGSTVEQIKEKVREVYDEGRVLNIKLGLDPTAPDIHLGHAVVLRKIKQLQDLGHKATIIIGDFTGMIGDPSGKSKTRPMLTREEIEINAKTYEDQIYKIIKKEQTELRFNSEWLGQMNFKNILELAAKTTVARLLERDDFASRYQGNQPIGLHEFFYPLMQAYDSVAIKADIELGGTDQTFNILMGRNVQKDYGLSPQIALFMPLLEGIDGNEKMSKSLGNYVGINEIAMDMYVKIMKLPDDKIIKYYNLCTDVHPDKIKEIELSIVNGANPRDIKMQLARDIISLYQPLEDLNKAEEDFKMIYQKRVAPDDIPVLYYSKKDLIDDKLNLVDVLFSSNKYASKSEIRRLITQGGVKFNGLKFTLLEFVPTDDLVISVGKGTMFHVREK